MDINERIKEQLENNPVLVYIKGTPDFPQCGFSGQTVAALKAIGRPFSYVNIFDDPEIREGLKTYSNWPTFPQLYVDGELVGGCDIVNRFQPLFTSITPQDWSPEGGEDDAEL